MTQLARCQYLVIARSSLHLFPMLNTAPDNSSSGSAATVFEFTDSIPKSVTERAKQVGLSSLTLMDDATFFIDHDLIQQQSMYNAFFDYIAERYEKLIDPSRNDENISFLVEELSKKLGALDGKRILDFGCGSGLAFSRLSRSGALAVGYDQSAHMRELARSRGMWIVDKLPSASGQLFRGAIASYVLHVVTSSTELEKFAKSLEAAGVILANFHKGTNLTWVTKVLRASGCDSEEVSVEGAERHGVYVAYTRR